MLSQISPVVRTPDEFLAALSSETRPNRDLEKLKSAAQFAFDAHQGQMRESGDPYITHPFAVALIVDELKLDTDSICGALLHDTVEDCNVTLEDIKTRFGEPVQDLVDGVTKLSKINFSSKAELQAESLRKMLLAMTKDVRVILIKLCDRLHNLRTLGNCSAAKQKRIAQETLDIFTPLAHRLGMYNLKWSLEDLCLKHAHPDAYYEILKRIAQKRKEREAFVEEIISSIRETLQKASLPCDISGRPKSFFSVYQKCQKDDKYLDEMYDLIGIRIITHNKEHCYAILGLVHSIWTPVQNRFKDYIAVPKPNMYQSLHTTVIHPDGQMFEVQIRTREMHETAEMGVAAHFLYKDNNSSQNRGSEKNPQELNWLKQIARWHSDIRDSHEFIENVKMDLFAHMVYAFTPNGQVIELREGATPVDFAYHVHTQVGNRCVGAKVDDRVVPLTYAIKNGDIIKIITSNASKGPSRDWLEFVKTKRARESILSFLKKSSKEDYITKGQKIVQHILEDKAKRLPSERKASWREILNSKEFSEACAAYGFRDVSFLYEAVGKNEFKLDSIVNQLSFFQVQQEDAEKKLESMRRRPQASKSRDTIVVNGMDDLLVKMSRCCNPVFGDEIVGYISRGRGLVVHRKSCPNAVALSRSEAEREVEVHWNTSSLVSKQSSFQTEVEILTHNQSNVLMKVTQVISNFKINIISMNARSKKDGGFLNLIIEIGNIAQLNNLIRAISDLEEVVSIYRVEPDEKKKPARSTKNQHK